MKSTTVVWAILALSACGGSEPTDPSSDEVLVVSIAPNAGSMALAAELDVSGAVEALGASLDGNVLAIAAGHTHEVVGGAIEIRSLYAANGDPTKLGAVHT